MQIKHPVGYYYFVESSLLVTGHLLLSGKLSLQMILTPKQVLSARKCYSALPTQFLLTVAPSMLSSAPSLLKNAAECRPALRLWASILHGLFACGFL